MVRGNPIFNCMTSFVGQSYTDRLFWKFAIFSQWHITTTFLSSPKKSFAAEFAHIGLLTIATVRFAAKT